MALYTCIILYMRQVMQIIRIALEVKQLLNPTPGIINIFETAAQRKGGSIPTSGFAANDPLSVSLAGLQHRQQRSTIDALRQANLPCLKQGGKQVNGQNRGVNHQRRVARLDRMLLLPFWDNSGDYPINRRGSREERLDEPEDA